VITPLADDHFQFDYQRHLAAQDLLPQHQEDFQRLVKLLRYAPGFQLLFARIADESYRSMLIGKLDDLMRAAGRPVETIDLSSGERYPDFNALEARLESTGQQRAVIHLVNATAWLQGPRLEALNLRRNALAETLDSTLLWWLPAKALERLAQQAPDAWSWRGGVFDFLEGIRAGTSIPTLREEAKPAIGPLTLAQRSHRLAELRQLLGEDTATDIPDEFRLNLLLEQAELYESLGQWDLADRALRQQALPLAERLGDVRSKAVTQGQIADILMARGELDEALRIRTQEELPVYERLGDVRSKAVTQGRIADILMARGELDEALALHEQRLPVALKMNDIDSVAHIRFSMAHIRLQHGDHERGGLQTIQEELAEAFAISRKLDRPDFIGAIGQLLAQVLALGSRQDEALAVLDQAESAYRRLADGQGEVRVRQLREAIAGRG